MTDIDDFETVDFNPDFTRLKDEHKANIEVLYSIGKMHELLSKDLEESHPVARKLDSQLVQVDCDGDPVKTNTYYYKFRVRRGNDERCITKRFNNFKDFRLLLKESLFTGNEKFKVTDGDRVDYFEGYHVIPVLDESVTPATIEQARDRMQQLRLFLLKILSNNVLAACKATEAFLKIDADQSEGYVANLKGKANRFVALVTGKIFEESNHVKNLLRGQQTTQAVDAALMRVKANAKHLQANLETYVEMLAAAGVDLSSDAKADVRKCVAFAKDAELQVDSIIEAERTCQMKVELRMACKMRKDSVKDELDSEVFSKLVNNMETWLANTKIFMKIEKESIMATLDNDMKVLERLVINLMAKITAVNSN